MRWDEKTMGKGNNNQQRTLPHINLGGAVREIGVFVALIIMVIIFALIDSSYVTVGNFVDIVKQATINGILAIGITFAIISGGIDLSLGSTFAIVIVAVGQLTVMGVPPLGSHVSGLWQYRPWRPLPQAPCSVPSWVPSTACW